MKSKVIKDLAKKLMVGAGHAGMISAPALMLADKEEEVKAKPEVEMPEPIEPLLGGLGEDMMDEDSEEGDMPRAEAAEMLQEEAAPKPISGMEEEQIRAILKQLMK